MTTFLLIRHADNDFVGKTLVGWTPGIHLNQRGKDQAARLAAGLQGVAISAIYSSPLERARETAAPLAAQAALPVEISEAIGEIRFGQWTGCTLQQLANDPVWKQFNSQRSITRIPGGELMLEVQLRMVEALGEMHRKHPDGIVAVVSHGDPLRAILLHYLGMPLDLLDRIEVGTASVSVVTLADAAPRVLRINNDLAAA